MEHLDMPPACLGSHQTRPRQSSALPHHSPPAAHGNPSGHAFPRARPIPAAPRQPTALPSVCNGRSCLNEICLPAAIVQDRPTLSRPIARGLRQPRDNLNHLCNWAPSTMPRLPPTPRPPPRPTTRCAAHCVANAVPTSCRSVPTIAIASPEGWYSDYGGSPPPTHRTRTKSYTPGSTKCTFSTSPAFDCGWIPTPRVRTEGTELRATLVTGG
jgi:hypothetical protein